MKLGRHPLTSGAPEPLAVAWGEDDLGVFMAFSVEGIEHRMRWVPPGRFVMGTPLGEPGRKDVEGPMRAVTRTRGCWLGETSVTQSLWAAVMDANPSHFVGDPTRPVEQVSWHDGQRFLAALNTRVPGLGARLPTEAEWEFACRGGTIGASWRQGHREAALDRIAWYGGNSRGSTHPVAHKEPNPLGLYDMLGNVAEWCSDWFGAYDAAAVSDPAGPPSGVGRVVRGGAWSDGAAFVRAGRRVAHRPDDRGKGLGLRLARDAR